MEGDFIDSNVHEILYTDDKFPKQLLDVRPRIKKLYFCGNIDLVSERLVTIVGSRNNSEYGKWITEEITHDLVFNDIVIVSGMAIGIDTIAHKTCIKNGGKTIAVLGSGFNYIYPSENTKLFNEIIETGGLIISEYPVNTPVQKKNFPKRNRIVSGLSEAVLVVEGSARSGTSITARCAVSQKRKLFYVPNCVGNKNSTSTLRLAREGAKIATCGKDIIEELGLKYNKPTKFNTKKFNNILNKMDEDTKKIFLCLKENGNLDCESISVKTGIDVIKVNQLLSYLELEDIIKSVEINKYNVCGEFCE